MAEEKKRYCLVLDRTSIVAKSTMEFCEHVSISCLKCGGMHAVSLATLERFDIKHLLAVYVLYCQL